MRKARCEATLRVHHIDDRTVVHRIVAAGFRMLGVEDAVALGGPSDLFRCPGQRKDRCVKSRDIGFEHFWRVALRVDSDEYGTDGAALRPELVERDCDVVECGGTRIRAMRIAKID